MLWSKHLLKKVRVKNCSKTYMINTCESYVCTMYHNGFKIFFEVALHCLSLSYWTRLYKISPYSLLVTQRFFVQFLRSPSARMWGPSKNPDWSCHNGTDFPFLLWCYSVLDGVGCLLFYKFLMKFLMNCLKNFLLHIFLLHIFCNDVFNFLRRIFCDDFWRQFFVMNSFSPMNFFDKFFLMKPTILFCIRMYKHCLASQLWWPGSLGRN